MTQKHVARIAAGQREDAHVTHHRVLDVAGLFAAKAAKLPPTSDADLIRDLRAGLHIAAMQAGTDEASMPVRFKAEAVFPALGVLYQLAPAERGEALGNTLEMLDDLILSTAGMVTTGADTELVVHAAARLCLAPEADPPILKTPPSKRSAA